MLTTNVQALVRRTHEERVLAVLRERGGLSRSQIAERVGLSRTTLGFTHVTEFLKEGPRPTYGLPTPVIAGPMFGGPTAGTTWLRLRSTYDAAHDAYDVRMASSTDGATWTWGGAWSLPRTDGRPLRIGLVWMNAAGATATFDYVRTRANAG